MPDQFASPKRRVARAKKHVLDIKSRVGSFFGGKPYTRLVERNAQGLDEHKIKLTADIPDEITDLAYEAIEALRSGLDQAMHPIAVACGAKRPDLIHFPIADTSLDVDNILNGRLKIFPPDIKTFLRCLKPYKGGNDLVWALNQVRRQSAHRLIMPVGTASAGMFINDMISKGGTRVLAPNWDNKKNEIIFAEAVPGAHLYYNFNIAFYIAFGPVDGLAGRPVLDALNNATCVVERIVLGLEAEARRIGLVT